MDMKKFISFDVVGHDRARKFGKNNGNRALNLRHLNKIKGQFIENLDMIPPITVNARTNNVLDGQHRLKAFLSLVDDQMLPEDSRIKVMFVDIPADEEKDAIIEANTNSKNWGIDDYINTYTKAGYSDYAKLDNWCRAHSLCCDVTKDKETGETNTVCRYRAGAAIITGRRCISELKKATFSFTDDEAKEADIIHTEMIKIAELFNLKGKGPWMESLAISWHGARKQHPFNVWMKEFRSKKSRFMKMPKDNSKDWESIFGQIHFALDKKNSNE